MSTARLFLAIDLPESIKAAIGRLGRKLVVSGLSKGTRWIDPVAMHLTLAFLGDVPEERIEDVKAAAGRAAAGSPTFDLEVRGLGAFPSLARPRVLWAGIEGSGIESLRLLNAMVQVELAEIHAPQDSRFSPHVTLARLDDRAASPKALDALRNSHADWSAGEFQVDELITFRSNLSPRGVRYEALAKSKLSGKPR